MGDAIASAVVGFNDPSWAIRNSSTMVYAAAMLRAVDANKNASSTDGPGKHAITASELFRSAPMLSTFLCSVMKAGCDGILETYQGMSTPPIFPILLLLSRVQAIHRSEPDAANLASPFVSTVLDCLSHRHYGVRRVAALALANLCSGERPDLPSSLPAMIHGCHDLFACAVREKDWNAAHGALLAIKALVKSFSEALNILHRSGLSGYFIHLGKSPKAMILWPPLCISELIHILTEIKSHDDSDDNSLHDTEDCCVNSLAIVTGTRLRAGESELVATAARALCFQKLSSIWNVSSDWNSFSSGLLQISSLLSSTDIDVRLHATKIFKKEIYRNVDNLLAASDVAATSRCDRLVEISRSLLRAVQVELRQNEGPHTPTLRRLSRCLLESMGAYYHLNSLKGHALSLSVITFDGELWHTAENMLKLDRCGDETPLTGNAAELMAYIVADLKSREQLLDEEIRRIRTFAGVVRRVNDPMLSWRLRHSAAVAVEYSHLLGWSTASGCDASNQRELRKVQQSLLQEISLMLQDSDPDVRAAAARAATKATHDHRAASASYHTELSERVLDETSRRMAVQARQTMSASDVEDYVEHLVQGIISGCDGLKSKILTLEEEWAHSENEVTLDSLLNVGTSRKIFEDEVGNTYAEAALANQLCVRSMLEFQSKVSTMPPKANTLIDQCFDILSVLKRRLVVSSDDMLHEITRSNATFSGIHSLLLAGSALLYLGILDAQKTEELESSAREIISKSQDNVLHPCIREVLQVVSVASAGTCEISESIKSCCFLLPAAS